VLLDTADAAAAAGVAASGAVILAAEGWYWLDPTVALIIAVVISSHAQTLIRKVLIAIRNPRHRHGIADSEHRQQHRTMPPRRSPACPVHRARPTRRSAPRA
jgi:Co/Zn/Cd efflux system component